MTRKATHIILLMLMIFSLSAESQQLMLYPDLKIARIGDDCWLQMPVAFWAKDLAPNQKMVITPQLRSASESVSFPSAIVYGTRAYYQRVRSDYAGSKDEMHLRVSKSGEWMDSCYVKSIPWQSWMSQADIVIHYDEVDGCDNVVRSHVQSFRIPSQFERSSASSSSNFVATASFQTHADRIRHHNGTANIDFPINQSDIDPDYRDNRAELAKIHEAIDKVTSDSTVIMHHISLLGYTSPDGPYDFNTKISYERTLALRRYISEEWGISDSLISVSYESEDWQGVRRYVEASNFDGKEGLLAIIDGTADPDARLQQIERQYPSAYKVMTDSLFPRLRRTDYRIDYIERYQEAVVLNDRQVAISGDSIQQQELRWNIGEFAAEDDWNPQPTNSPITTFKPWVAIKTNMLYDLAVAPNIELELPLGAKSNWSLMAEYNNPWWRWDRKSQCYQVREGGLELRYWLTSMCRGARPWLTGHFVGVYGAYAIYDWEHNDVGDQGDVWSGGFTYGYSWPLSARFNLEASVSVGVVAGDRRHYNAEFDSTHLIYKYTSNVFYAGPTKLKLSLVWILGSKSKKGGSL